MPSAFEHLDEAYMEAAKAQLSVSRQDVPGARLYLQATRLHLDQAAQAGANAAMTDTIAELRLRVDRAMGALATPRDAAMQTRGLVAGFTDAFRSAVRPTGGGGGGGPVKPPPFKGDVVPQASDETQPSGQPNRGRQAPTLDTTDKDRPNQSGRQ
jgi:hypothetical protein